MGLHTRGLNSYPSHYAPIFLVQLWYHIPRISYLNMIYTGNCSGLYGNVSNIRGLTYSISTPKQSGSCCKETYFKETALHYIGNCLGLFIHIHIHIHIHIYTYMCTYTYTHTPMYIYIYIYTVHIYTQYSYTLFIYVYFSLILYCMYVGLYISMLPRLAQVVTILEQAFTAWRELTQAAAEKTPAGNGQNGPKPGLPDMWECFYEVGGVLCLGGPYMRGYMNIYK